MHRPALIVLAALLAALLCAPAASAQPEPPRPPWGACGNSTAEDKVVARFSAGVTLLCGGPIGSAEPRYGYRHILDRHRSDLENLTFGTSIGNWRDLADLAIETIAKDPDATSPAPGNQICMSRVLLLYNEDTGEQVRQQVFVIYIDASARTVNTLTPRSTQC